MGIRTLFQTNWEAAYKSAAKYRNSEVLPEQRVIIISRCIGRRALGQLIVMFDEKGIASLVTSRFCATILAIPAYLHILEQAKRLEAEGIVCNIAFEKGLVTCTYSRKGWLERVAQESSAFRYAQEAPVRQPQTPFEKSTD